MNPHDVYGEFAGRIFVEGECWLWHGPMTNGIKPIPVAYPKGKELKLPNLGRKAIGRVPIKEYRVACEDRRCLNLEHMEPTNTEVDRMLYIKERVERQGKCLLWQGDTLAGKPRMFWYRNGNRNSPPLMVRRFVWCIEHLPAGVPWPTAGNFEATCGNDLCVFEGHIKRTVGVSTDGCA